MVVKLSTDLKGDLGPRSTEVREKIIEEAIKIDESYQNLAQLLHEAYDNAYFIRWGFTNFKEYCEGELGVQYRKAKYLVGIAQVVKDLGIKWDEIEGIGWTKMRLLAPIIKNDGVGDWLELAKEFSVKELEKLIADAKIGMDISASGGDRIVSLNFKVTPEQSEIILDALEYSKKIIESDDNVLALEQMSYDYIMQSDGPPERTSLERLIEYAEHHYGVGLLVADREEIADMVEEKNENVVGDVGT